MKNRVIVAAFALFCVGALACANWNLLPREQKVEIVCNTAFELLEPECARASNVDLCLESFEVASVTCESIADQNVAQACPLIGNLKSKCAEFFSDPLDHSSCLRAVAIAKLGCDLSIPPAPAPEAVSVD
jgi:hypothetical protein